MRKCLMPTACVVAVCAAYWVGLRQAAGDDMPSCFVCVEAPQPPICEDCQSSDCPACYQGTCPGNNKACAPNFTCSLQPADGSMGLVLVKYSCFAIEGCKPASGEHCSVPGQIGCIGDGTWHPSSTTYSVPLNNESPCHAVPG